MAIPHDPYFLGKTTLAPKGEIQPLSLASLNHRIRRLGLPVAAHTEIASYLGTGINVVTSWFYAQATIQQTQTVTRKKPVRRMVTQTVTVPWARDFSRTDLLRTMQNSRKVFTRETLLDALRTGFGLDYPVKTTKDSLIYTLETTRSWTKDRIGSLMDSIRPREIQVERAVTETIEVEEEITVTKRLPDMLSEEEYAGFHLSDFDRDTYLRKKADLALALLGEVTQTPQDGVEEGFFLLKPNNLMHADDVYLWPLRVGFGDPDTPFWMAEFISEMWFRAHLTPGPDIASKTGNRWYITVAYYKVYEARELKSTHGWPERDPPEKVRPRTEKEMEEKIKQKKEWEEYLRKRQQKKNEKRRNKKRKKK